jgi:hypothetical protein
MSYWYSVVTQKQNTWNKRDFELQNTSEAPTICDKQNPIYVQVPGI